MEFEQSMYVGASPDRTDPRASRKRNSSRRTLTAAEMAARKSITGLSTIGNGIVKEGSRSAKIVGKGAKSTLGIAGNSKIAKSVAGNTRNVGRYLQTAAKEATPLQVIAARDALDKGIKLASGAVSNVPVLGEVANAAQDIYHAFMNPLALPLAPLYSTYRAGKAIANIATGKKETFHPADYRLTASNLLDRTSKSGIPIISQAAKLLSFLS